jgi:uncharacterized membrane protein
MTDVPPDPKDNSADAATYVKAALQKLPARGTASSSGIWARYHAASQTYLQNLLAGLVIVGPAVITIYFVSWFVNAVDAWIKALAPGDPETYMPIAVPISGFAIALFVLPRIGAYGAKLIGGKRKSIEGDKGHPRMLLVRAIVRSLKRRFTSVGEKTTGVNRPERVGLIEYPSKGLWSIVFAMEPGVELDGIESANAENAFVSVFIPVAHEFGGCVCFVPRKSVTFVDVPIETAEKIFASAPRVSMR